MTFYPDSWEILYPFQLSKPEDFSIVETPFAELGALLKLNVLNVVVDVEVGS